MVLVLYAQLDAGPGDRFALARYRPSLINGFNVKHV
jgi:hypothetical protein